MFILQIKFSWFILSGVDGNIPFTVNFVSKTILRCELNVSRNNPCKELNCKMIIVPLGRIKNVVPKH